VSGANENRPGSFAKRRALSQFRVALVFLVLGLAAAAASAAMLLSGTSTAIGAAALVFVGVAAKHFFDERLALGVRWGKGGNAEQAVGSLLDELRQDGFIVEHDLDDVVAGNVDHLLRKGDCVFLVETKFCSYVDRDLRKARRDAAQVARRRQVRWVQPIICLATRTYGPRKVGRVVVLGLDELLPYLRSLGC
jgi:hypothetical protein